MIAPCPKCAEQVKWQRVTCSPAKTVRSYKCECGERFTVDEPPQPPEFFQTPQEST
jgi:hypothetical protein